MTLGKEIVAAMLAAESGGCCCGGGETAVYVIAAITVKDGKRAELIEIFKKNVPNVHAEDGCKLYQPTVDFPSGIPIQPALRKNVMTVVEQWSSIDALMAHLAAPHMKAYGEQVKDLVEGVEIQVLQAC